MKASPMLLQHELDILLSLIGETKEDILEIGCHEGFTTLAIASAFPNRNILAVDCALGTTSYLACSSHQAAEVPSWDTVCVAARGIHNVSYWNIDTKSLLFQIPLSIGVVFIDGDHTYRGVENDFLLCASSNARRIIFHDYGNPAEWIGVKKYFDGLTDLDLYKKTIVPNTMLAYIDIL